MHRFIKSALALAVCVLPYPLYAQFAPPSGGCRPGMHLEGYSCVYDAPAGQSRAPRTKEWIDVHVAVAWHPNANDVWAIWNVRESQGGQAAAEEAVLSDCRKAMGDGCTIAGSGINSSVAIARHPNGFSAAARGKTSDEAKAEVVNFCSKRVTCPVVHVFTAKPWVEYTDEPGFDELKRYRPNSRSVIARFGAATVAQSNDPLWADKVWASSGHATETEAQDAARNQCAADSSAPCTTMITNKDGVIAVYRDENLQIGMVNERNAGAARDAVRKACAQDRVKCALVELIDVKRPGSKIIAVAAVLKK